MPNFWTKAIQSIREKISGPRTNDTELNLALEEAFIFDRNFSNMKKNFMKYIMLCNQLNLCINEIIDGLSQMNRNFSMEYLSRISENLRVINIDNKLELNLLTTKINEWPSYTKQISKLFEHKEELRKIYDHYQLKIHNIQSQNGTQMHTQDHVQYMERNVEKYRQSKENYITFAAKVHEEIVNIINEGSQHLKDYLENLLTSEIHNSQQLISLEDDIVSKKESAGKIETTSHKNSTSPQDDKINQLTECLKSIFSEQSNNQLQCVPYQEASNTIYPQIQFQGASCQMGLMHQKVDVASYPSLNSILEVQASNPMLTKQRRSNNISDMKLEEILEDSKRHNSKSTCPPNDPFSCFY